MDGIKIALILLPLLSAVAGAGVAWGVLRGALKALEERVAEMGDVRDQVACLREDVAAARAQLDRAVEELDEVRCTAAETSRHVAALEARMPARRVGSGTAT